MIWIASSESLTKQFGEIESDAFNHYKSPINIPLFYDTLDNRHYHGISYHLQSFTNQTSPNNFWLIFLKNI
jgi:hypothetical protein